MKAQSFSKTEIDRLGDRLRSGESEDDLRTLDAYRFSFANAYGQVLEKSKSVSSTEVTGRPAKSTAAIIEKLHRESIRLSQMQDIAGCRVLVTDLKAQDALVAQLSTAFDNAVVVDRRNNPSHGYRAVHLVVTIKNRMVEIQVRTSLQQFWAVLSEKVADKFGNAIKYGGGEVQARQELESLSSSISKIELLRTARNLDPEILVSIADVEDHVRLLGTDLLAYLGVNE